MLFFLTDAVSRLVKTNRKISGTSKLFRSWNTADTVFLFSYERNLFPLIPLGECHCNMGVWDRQGECYKLVTWILLQFQH